MTAVPDSDLVSDAELAVAAAAGDQSAFAGIYDRYADRLYDFCVGMVRDRNTAADCVQDTFCTAATRLESLRDPDKLRPWLYAIARNEALRCIRERRREQPSDELPEASSSEPSPDTLAARSELAELVAQAAGGLSDRDRTVLELTYRHGLDGPELAEALGVSAATARTLTHRLRETVERSLGALLVMRSAIAGHTCPELAASVKDWDGQFTVLTRKRVARHIDSCLTCEASRSKLVNREALLGAAPLFIPAPAGLRHRTLDRIQLVCAQSALAGPAAADAAGHAGAPEVTPTSASEADGADAATVPAPPFPLEETGVTGGDAPGDDKDRRRRRALLLLFLLLAIALFAALWLTIAWPFTKKAPLAPAGVTENSSQPSTLPTTQAPPTTTPPPPVVSTTVPASPPPTYRQPTTQPFVPPASGSDASAPPKSSALPIPSIRPTPPPSTGPLFPVPRVTSPSASGQHSKPGSSGTSGSSGGTSGTTGGTSSTAGGTSGTSGGTTDPSGGTSGPSGPSGSTGPVR